MGIYSDGKIYGLKWTLDYEILFEEKYEEEISSEVAASMKVKFDEIKEKEHINLYYYAKCSSTLELPSKPFMIWMPINKEDLIEWFDIKNA